MVELTDVNEYLVERGLGVAHLPFLSTAATRMSALVFQPRGDLVATVDSLRAEARDELIAQMKGFLALAKTRHCDFAACPEYSCPWPALVQSAIADNLPSRGALWSICCESIKRDDLESTVNDLQKAGLRVLMPDLEDGAGDFINLVCHLFWIGVEVSDLSLVVLLQAKTSPMGGVEFERDGLVCGRRIFRFGVENENRLVCLVCSDALGPDFQQNIVNQISRDTLIIHLQLNKDPGAVSFREFRDRCNSWSPRTTEILSLNWAAGTQIKVGGGFEPFIEEPKTIYYRTIEGVNGLDEDIIANDKKGLYLTNLEDFRSAAYVFHPDEHVYEFRTSKPVMVGPAAVALRTGPKMHARYEWSVDQWLVATSDADDKFESYLASNPDASAHLTPYKTRHVDVERLMQLSTGYILNDASFTWKKLSSFRLEKDDTASRLRLCWSDEGMGGSSRTECQNRFKALVSIVDTPSTLPVRLAAFRSVTPYLSYNPAPAFRRYRNLVVNEMTGTAVYLGSQPRETTLKNAKEQLEKRLYDCKEDLQLLSIMYRDASGVLRDYMDHSSPSISDDPDCDPANISTV